MFASHGIPCYTLLIRNPVTTATDLICKHHIFALNFFRRNMTLRLVISNGISAHATHARQRNSEEVVIVCNVDNIPLSNVFTYLEHNLQSVAVKYSENLKRK